MEKLTPQQALEVIGNALAHESLKLSQREHVTLIEAYKVIKENLKDESNPSGHLEKL